tara:strand:+ start:484 stop:684 length:201 start_codon:yes stop_codon:yes gene_type:complete
MTFNFKDSNRENSLNGNAINNKTKTTNVNVLLNRVRLDQKKTLKKNIIVFLSFVGLICSIAIYFII